MLNPDFAGPQFNQIQIIRALGQPLVMVTISLIATAYILPQDAGSASSLFNILRNLGGAIGIALLATLLDSRAKVYFDYLRESLVPSNPQVAERLALLGEKLGSDQAALAKLSEIAHQQAAIMAYNDAFHFIGIALGISMIAVLLTRSLARRRHRRRRSLTPRTAWSGAFRFRLRMSSINPRTRALLLVGAFAPHLHRLGHHLPGQSLPLREQPPFVIATLRSSPACWPSPGCCCVARPRCSAATWAAPSSAGDADRRRPGRPDLCQPVPADRHAGDAYTTLPLWSVALEWLLDERPPLWVLCGLAVASGGILLLMGNGLGEDPGFEQWFAGALVVMATLLWAVGAWLLRKRGPFRSSWMGLAMQMLVGTALLAGFGLWRGDWQGFELGRLSPGGWLWLAYLVLPVSLGVYPAYFWLLREVRPSLVSTFAFVNPVVALLLGYLILDERLSVTALLACLATLGG